LEDAKSADKFPTTLNPLSRDHKKEPLSIITSSEFGEVKLWSWHGDFLGSMTGGRKGIYLMMSRVFTAI